MFLFTNFFFLLLLKGTSSSLIGMFEKQSRTLSPLVNTRINGRYTTPSVVSIDANGKFVYVGISGEIMQTEVPPENVILYPKRLRGSK